MVLCLSLVTHSKYTYITQHNTTYTYVERLTWKVVDVPSIQQEVAIHWVTEWGHVAREGHAGPYIAPERPGIVDTHL